MNWLDQVKWDDKGLVPVIAQERDTGDVLMFAWRNREALARTAELGRADAVLAASIFHFGDHTVREAKELMRARGIEVRL